MSSPIRPDKDANPALKYAPPWVRDQDRELTEFFSTAGTAIVVRQWCRS